MTVPTASASRGKQLTVEEEIKLNQRVARRLAREMAETHPGQWVGLVRGEVVIAATHLDEVIEALRKVEPDPRRGFVFKAGENYRKKIVILDHFHFDNGQGGELCLESWAQFRSRCGET